MIKKKNEKDDQEKTPSEEDSESSEYYPEPDEEGNAKKDNVRRKGLHSYLEQIEIQKQEVHTILEQRNALPKMREVEVETKVDFEQVNTNKKLLANPILEEEGDAFFFKPQEQQQPQKKS